MKIAFAKFIGWSFLIWFVVSAILFARVVWVVDIGHDYGAWRSWGLDYMTYIQEGLIVLMFLCVAWKILFGKGR